MFVAIGSLGVLLGQGIGAGYFIVSCRQVLLSVSMPRYVVGLAKYLLASAVFMLISIAGTLIIVLGGYRHPPTMLIAGTLGSLGP